MDIVGTLVGREEPQALGQTLLELRSGEVHAQIQIDHLLAGVVGISEALIGLGLLLTVGEVHDHVHARLLQSGIHIGVAAQLRVDGGGATVQHILAHAGGGDVAEVAELGVGQVGIIGTVIGALQVVHDVLGHVAALLRHLEGDLHGIGHTLPSGPVPRLILVGVLLGQLIGLGEVAHVDGHGDVAGGLTVGVLLHDDGGLAGIHIGIGRHHRQGQGLIQELDRHQIAPGKAQLAHEVLGLAVGVDVAVLGHPDVGVQTADGDLAVIRLLRRDDGHAALRLAVPGLGDGAAQLIGDVFHDDLVQRQAGVKLGCRCGKGIVGVAAGGQEVVGDDSVGGILIESLAVNAVDGDAVDGLGTIIGGAGIGGVVLVVILGAVHRQLHAGGLGEAAQRDRGAVGGRFQRLQQLGTGDIHHSQGVAEGQDGVDILLGDIASLDGSTDAAAVGNGHSIGHIYAGGLGLDGPQHGIGDEVTHVGLLGAVAGLLGTVELHLALGENNIIGSVDGILDVLGGLGHSGIGLIIVEHGDGFIVDLLGVPNLHQLIADDLSLGVVNGDDAHIRQSRTGGLDLLPVGTLGHNGVGVTVDDEVDAGDILGQVIGGVGLGAGVHTQMRQADDNVSAFCPQCIHLILCSFVHLVACQELQPLDQGGVGLGLRLGGLQAEEADLYVAHFLDHMVVKDGLAVLQHIGAKNIKLGLFHILVQLGIAVVELVVADGGHVIACDIHHGDGICALVDADIDAALTVVAGVNQKDGCASGLIVSLQRRHLFILVDGTVDIVGVQDDGFAIQIFRCRGICPGRGHKQRQCHNHGHKQC